MLENLSFTQKAVGGVVVVAGVVGWVFAFVQIGQIEDLALAKGELAHLQRDLEETQSERTEATESLQELTAALGEGNVQRLSLRSEIEGSRAKLETIRAKVQRQQALLDGSMLRFKTNARAKVRAGPGTDTDEVAVVPAGKTLQVFEIVEDGNWYKVGGMGYIFHELLEPVKTELAE